MSLQDPKKALSDDSITPLVNTGAYKLGAEKPAESTIKFRNEKTTDDGTETSKLKIYDSAGQSKIEASSGLSSRRRLASGDDES